MHKFCIKYTWISEDVMKLWIELLTESIFADSISVRKAWISPKLIYTPVSSARRVARLRPDVVGDYRSEESATCDFEFSQMFVFFCRSVFSLSRGFVAFFIPRRALSRAIFSLSRWREAKLRAATFKRRPVLGPGRFSFLYSFSSDADGQTNETASRRRLAHHPLRARVRKKKTDTFEWNGVVIFKKIKLIIILLWNTKRSWKFKKYVLT